MLAIFSCSLATLKSLGAGHKESLLVNSSVIIGKDLRKTAEVMGKIINLWRVYQFHDTSDEAAIKQKGVGKYLEVG